MIAPRDVADSVCNQGRTARGVTAGRKRGMEANMSCMQVQVAMMEDGCVGGKGKTVHASVASAFGPGR